MDAGVLCLGITHALREMKVLAGKHCLGSSKGWIHAFPTAWQGAAMEDDEKPIVVGVGENVFVELHHRLLVATEEVYLYATNAYALHPCHLLTTHMRLVHQVAWALRSVVPCSVAVIPEIQRHTLRLAVACQFGYFFATYLSVPKSVYQYRLVTHGGREVDVTLLLVEIARWIHTDNPAPRATSILSLLLCLIFWFHYIERNGGLYDWGKALAERDGAPWGVARERNGG